MNVLGMSEAMIPTGSPGPEHDVDIGLKPGNLN